MPIKYSAIDFGSIDRQIKQSNLFHSSWLLTFDIILTSLYLSKLDNSEFTCSSCLLGGTIYRLSRLFRSEFSSAIILS